jgi:hypothetical protein
MTDETLYIVEVDDDCAASLVGHGGCSYASPPQPPVQALALVRVLLGCPQRELRVNDAPWHLPIAGGRRTIRLHVANRAGQLAL